MSLKFSWEKFDNTSSFLLQTISPIYDMVILSIPFAIYKCGLVIAICILLVFSIINCTTSFIMLYLTKSLHVNSYYEVIRIKYGKTSRKILCVAVLIILEIYFVGYLLIILQLTNDLMQMLSFTVPEDIILMGVNIVAYSLMFFQSTEYLRYTNAISFIAILYLIIILGYSTVLINSFKTLNLNHLKYFPNHWFEVFQAIPIFIMSFISHFQIFDYKSHINDVSIEYIKSINIISNCFQCLFNITTGVLGYLILQNNNIQSNLHDFEFMKLKGNILLELSSLTNSSIIICKALFLIVLVLAMSNNVISMRFYFVQIFDNLSRHSYAAIKDIEVHSISLRPFAHRRHHQLQQQYKISKTYDYEEDYESKSLDSLDSLSGEDESDKKAINSYGTSGNSNSDFNPIPINIPIQLQNVSNKPISVNDSEAEQFKASTCCKFTRASIIGIFFVCFINCLLVKLLKSEDLLQLWQISGCVIPIILIYFLPCISYLTYCSDKMLILGYMGHASILVLLIMMIILILTSTVAFSVIIAK